MTIVFSLPNVIKLTLSGFGTLAGLGSNIKQQKYAEGNHLLFRPVSQCEDGIIYL